MVLPVARWRHSRQLRGHAAPEPCTTWQEHMRCCCYTTAGSDLLALRFAPPRVALQWRQHHVCRHRLAAGQGAAPAVPGPVRAALQGRCTCVAGVLHMHCSAAGARPTLAGRRLGDRLLQGALRHDASADVTFSCAPRCRAPASAGARAMQGAAWGQSWAAATQAEGRGPTAAAAHGGRAMQGRTATRTLPTLPCPRFPPQPPPAPPPPLHTHHRDKGCREYVAFTLLAHQGILSNPPCVAAGVHHPT